MTLRRAPMTPRWSVRTSLPAWQSRMISRLTRCAACSLSMAYPVYTRSGQRGIPGFWDCPGRTLALCSQCSKAGSECSPRRRAMAIEHNKALVTRYVEEFWNQGHLAAADELMAAEA